MHPRSTTIDLNADLGEGFGIWSLADDDALLDLVSSANVACGFHAGDPSIMSAAARRAAACGVRLGAHIGFRDLHGFGRRPMVVDPAVLHDEALYQIGALQLIARVHGLEVSHVKPHGALYHVAAEDLPTAAAIVTAAASADESAPAIVGPPGSCLADAAETHGLAYIAEGFADRRYNDDGTLVSRSEGGTIDDPADVIAQGLSLALGEPIITRQGNQLSPRIDTLCVHGDSPSAVEAAHGLRGALDANEVRVTGDPK
jgi:UPF0271 protein